MELKHDSFAGVVLVTRSDSYLSSEELNTAEIPPHPVLGDIATLLSAAFYAAYTILIRVRVGDEDRADSKLLLGFVPSSYKWES